MAAGPIAAAAARGSGCRRCAHGGLAGRAGLGLVFAQAHESVAALLAAAQRPHVRRAGDHRARLVGGQGHLAAFGQAVAALGDYPLAGTEALGDIGRGGRARTSGHVAPGHRLVRAQNPHEVALRPGAHGGHRHDQDVAQGRQRDADIDELAGEQGPVGVGEARLGLHRAGGRIDLIVQRREDALVKHHGPRAVIGGHRQLGVIGLALQVRRGVLRDGELHVDRGDLGHHSQACGAAGLDEVAEIDGAQADAARHRRHDLGVAEVELGGADGGLVGHRRAFELFHQRGLGVDILTGDRVLGEQGLVALQQELGVAELRLVAGRDALRLQERHLQRTRVDDRDRLALFDRLSFLEEDLGDHPRDLRGHGHGRSGRDGSQAVQGNRDVGQNGGRHPDGGRWPAPPASAARARRPAAAARAAASRFGAMRQVDCKPDQPA